ncbi:MAG: toll/interleukin-1 receptor domain-containing protein [Woeseiaceae bacterium]
MGFVPGYKHDIFISYAHIDNRVPTHKEPPGWVGTIRDTLQDYIASELGTTDFDLWMDDKLEAVETVKKQLMDVVDDTAILLVVLSKSSANSIWCALERQTFIDKIAERAGPRLFVITPKPFNNTDEVIQKAFYNRLIFEFWVTDSDRKERTLGPPTWRQEQKFYDRCEDLATEIAKGMRILKENHAQQVETVSEVSIPAGDEPVIYLAHTTPDLESSRMEVKRYLEQHDVDVLPRGHYASEPDAYKDAATNDIGRSVLFAQLLSEHASTEPEDYEGGYNQMQFDLAKEAGIPTLQWRNPAVDLDAVEDFDHLELIDSGIVRAEALEDFKEHIVDTVNVEAAAHEEESEVARVFVYADPNEEADQEAAQKLSAALDEAGAECLLPNPTDDPKEFRKDIEQNMLRCNGMIVVYENTPLTWVQNQLRQGRRARLKRKKDADAGRLDWAVFESQAHAETDGLQSFSGLKFIRDDEADGTTQLSEFVRGLQN